MIIVSKLNHHPYHIGHNLGISCQRKDTYIAAISVQNYNFKRISGNNKQKKRGLISDLYLKETPENCIV